MLALVAVLGSSRWAQARGPELERVVVSSRDVDTDALLPELKMRRPDLDLSEGSRSRGAAKLTIERQGGNLHLELVDESGRTYTRDVPADDDIGSRALATDTAAFLDAVERGDVEPEPASNRGRSSRQEENQAGRFTDALQFGAGLGPAVTIPIGADAGRGIIGAGDLAIRVQTLHRILFAFGTRIGGRTGGGHRLVRGRLSFGGGYRLTVDRFDMPITGALTVEPWSVKQQGGAEPDLEAEAVEIERPASLIGIAARVAPAVLFPMRDGIMLRVGGALDLGFSGVPGSAVVRVGEDTDAGSDTVFRVGGFEATAVLEVGVWVPWTVIRGSRH